MAKSKYKAFKPAPKMGSKPEVFKAWEKDCADRKKFNDGLDKEKADKEKIKANVAKMKAK